MKKREKNYYLGLDIRTDSVGWAATNTDYSLLKFHGEPAWGTHVFEEASLADQRRTFRTARRRLDRKKQRIGFLQEIFASEIAKVDEQFYKRIKESQLYRSDCGNQHILFADSVYSDVDYYKAFFCCWFMGKNIN